MDVVWVWFQDVLERDGEEEKKKRFQAAVGSQAP
jgi:hypothetical protein